MFKKLKEKLRGFPPPQDQLCKRCATVYQVARLLKLKVSADDTYILHRMGTLCPEVCGTSFPVVFLRENFDPLPIADEFDMETECLIALHTASQMIGDKEDFRRVEEHLFSAGIVCETCLSNWITYSVRHVVSYHLVEFLTNSSDELQRG